MENSNKRNSNWSEAETLLLIEAWRENNRDLLSNKRNKSIYQKMSESMSLYHVNRTAEEIRRKIRNLTSDFRKEKIKCSQTGSSSSSWKFYSHVNDIIGRPPANGSSLEDESFPQVFVHENERVVLENQEEPSHENQSFEIGMPSDPSSSSLSADDIRQTRKLKERKKKRGKDYLMDEILNEIKLLRKHSERIDNEILETFQKQNELLEKLLNKT